MLLTKTVLISVSGNVSYYEEKGYEIPKHLDKGNKMRVKRDTKIIVNVLDLPPESAIRIRYQCDLCEKSFETKYSSYLKNKFDTCRECNMKKVASDIDSIKKKSGEFHPRFNQSLSEEDREKGRHYTEYPLWRTTVFEECNYTCQCCGDNSGGNLIAHHLNGWHWCKEERFCDYNGVTLCELCHDKFHKEYGYKDNTRAQFLDYLTKEIMNKSYSEASKVFAELE